MRELVKSTFARSWIDEIQTPSIVNREKGLRETAINGEWILTQHSEKNTPIEHSILPHNLFDLHIYLSMDAAFVNSFASTRLSKQAIWR